MVKSKKGGEKITAEELIQQVKELIQNIQDLEQDPENIRVVIPGYEDGLDDIESIKLVPIQLNSTGEWYGGKYESCEIGEEIEFALEIIRKVKTPTVIHINDR